MHSVGFSSIILKNAWSKQQNHSIMFAKILRNLEWLRHVEGMHAIFEHLHDFWLGGVRYVHEKWPNF
jgi:hypothetical protein